jgi:hypothetical protein
MDCDYACTMAGLERSAVGTGFAPPTVDSAVRQGGGPAAASAPAWPIAHRRRLRELWRSAGWPCRDTIELELVAGGLVERHLDAQGRETLRVTDAGVRMLAQVLAANRARRDAHEALVERVVREVQRAGRIAWRGLTLRAPLERIGADSPPAPAGPDLAADPGDAAGGRPAAEAMTRAAAGARWVMAMPDVYSIRHTTVEAYTEPVVHEVKVRRADLLADLRRPDKGEAYRAIGARCWYVLRAGIGGPDDVPDGYGVLIAHDRHFEEARPAPSRAYRVSFPVWMALARAAPEPEPDEAAQWPLRERAADAPGD